MKSNPSIESVILSVRSQRVILAADLAAIYGVETRRLNEQVKRNSGRFPGDFVFQITQDEFNALRSQNAILADGQREVIHFGSFASFACDPLKRCPPRFPSRSPVPPSASPTPRQVHPATAYQEG